MQRRADAPTQEVLALAGRALGAGCTIERAAGGVSAVVYRVMRDDEVFFLRLAEERDENLEVDALVLSHLRDLGVSVPEVVHVDRFVAALDRSVLVVRGAEGRAVTAADDIGELSAVMRAAGADLARINSVPVDGFSWIVRDEPRWPLRGELSSYAQFVTDELPEPWPGAFGELFNADELVGLEALVESEQARQVEATLVHGDFDLEHVFHHDGRYTGLIDFGEIRGAEPLFDLGVYAFVRWRRRDTRLFDLVVDGYREVLPLDDDAWPAIQRAGILKSLRQLGRWVGPGFGSERPVSDMARAIAWRLAQLS